MFSIFMSRFSTPSDRIIALRLRITEEELSSFASIVSMNTSNSLKLPKRMSMNGRMARTFST